MTRHFFRHYEVEITGIEWDDVAVEKAFSDHICKFLYIPEYKRLILSVHTTSIVTDLLAILQKVYPSAKIRYKVHHYHLPPQLDVWTIL